MSGSGVRRMMGLAMVTAVTAVAASVDAAAAQRAELAGWARMAADTFTDGPPSGQFDAQGVRASSPRFPSQPVQGFSGIQFGPACGAFWSTGDNGFGTRANSPDALLRIYRLTPEFQTARGGAGRLRSDGFIPLADPDRRVPFLLVREFVGDRLLTGGDLDPESIVAALDGTFWLGDEFGPFLLHVSADGRLLAPPIPLPNGAAGTVRSPQNPALTATGTAPGAAGGANLGGSRGVEGMARMPESGGLLALLEGTVAGDPAGRLRLYTFDPARGTFGDTIRYFPLDDPSHSIGDMAAVNEHEFLIVERDNAFGDSAAFKRVFRVDLARADAEGVVSKELVADLLDIANPHRLGGFGTTYRLPYITIENLLVMDSRTLLVMNDNNYPATGGRGRDVKDATEMILIRLARPLNLARGVGRPAECADPLAGARR
ncbi:esterase-like activity of phytase family protein [Longimicrobium terrae]|uniref:Glycerophosphoryl diester phosphodiesterase n=1 Tax=Longimicrobium terrae TaxID=1639882 RepID=A0A841GY49_9BACT|nr:esterase-like activity of phytase family protein [Longimicrobium terrae]MBB6070672.1 glycerophosphoryl diester phosphodiesterase [Longimicrobium terrae]